MNNAFLRINLWAIFLINDIFIDVWSQFLQIPSWQKHIKINNKCVKFWQTESEKVSLFVLILNKNGFLTPHLVKMFWSKRVFMPYFFKRNATCFNILL